jgi:hypothetical protein
MMTRTLPQVTLDQCEQITGKTGNHAAHTVYAQKVGNDDIPRWIPVGQCPGRRDTSSPAQSADPFHGIPDADEDDQDL